MGGMEPVTERPAVVYLLTGTARGFMMGLSRMAPTQE